MTVTSRSRELGRRPDIKVEVLLASQAAATLSSYTILPNDEARQHPSVMEKVISQRSKHSDAKGASGSKCWTRNWPARGGHTNSSRNSGTATLSRTSYVTYVWRILATELLLSHPQRRAHMSPFQNSLCCPLEVGLCITVVPSGRLRKPRRNRNMIGPFMAISYYQFRHAKFSRQIVSRLLHTEISISSSASWLYAGLPCYFRLRFYEDDVLRTSDNPFSRAKSSVLYLSSKCKAMDQVSTEMVSINAEGSAIFLKVVPKYRADDRGIYTFRITLYKEYKGKISPRTRFNFHLDGSTMRPDPADPFERMLGESLVGPRSKRPHRHRPDTYHGCRVLANV